MNIQELIESGEIEITRPHMAKFEARAYRVKVSDKTSLFNYLERNYESFRNNTGYIWWGHELPSFCVADYDNSQHSFTICKNTTDPILKIIRRKANFK